MLSGLSLNDISVVSVLALPLSWEEVGSIGSHLTFAGILAGERPPGSTESLDPQRSSPSGDRAIPSGLTRREHVSWVFASGSRRTSLDRQTGLSERMPATLSPFQRRQPQVSSSTATGLRPLYQLVVLGDADSGKTSLVNQVCSEF